MRAFRVGGKIGRRALTTQHVLVPKPKACVMRTAIPQSSSNGPLKPSWTPHHGLNSSPPTSKDASDMSRISKSSEPGQKHLAYIALGSNLGNRIQWIEEACNMMKTRGIEIKRTSCLWETEPMYVKDQEWFLNGVAEIETSLEPLALLDALQYIEKDSGRLKIVDKGPRNIDLDILLYDDQVVDHPRLQVPHPLMFEREFVLRPLAELIPGKSLNSKNPWKVTQDYLNEVSSSKSAMTTVTPLSNHLEPLRGLDPRRKTRIMAIYNASPDSFSGSGNATSWNKKQSCTCRPGNSSAALHEAIIDVGGQSTAPRVQEVSAEEETIRVLSAMQVIASGQSQLNFSVDTYRASVAKAAVEAGASIINDVSAGTMNSDMLPTMAQLGVTVVLMHMRGNPQTMTTLTSYPHGLIPTIASELIERVAAAEAAGIRRWRIILDPGIGFAKTAEQNIEILRRFHELRDWPGLRGLPWLVGSSRKRFIGKVTGVPKPSERTWGTAVTVAAAVQGGADIVRVHDVDEMEQVVMMSDAIWRA